MALAGFIMKITTRNGCAAAGGSKMTHLHIRLFGAPTVARAGGVEIVVSADKARALLAYLAVNAGQAQRREKLAGLLWPGFTDASARTNLRRALSDLRQAIGDHQATPPYLLVAQETIRFNTAGDVFVDVIAFSRLVKSGTPASPDAPPSAPSQTVIALLEEAVGLYRAPFLDGFSIPDSAAFEEWALLTREQLNRLALQALHRLAHIYQEQSAYAQALPHAWRQVEMEPWQESAQRQVMQLLALSGQRGAALAQYESCRKALAAELGIEPSEQTRQLYDLLRREAWPPATAVAATLPETPPRTVGPCPYRGLAAFRREDAPFFFCREAFVEQLVTAVNRETAVVAIVGASGSGKSSAVFAGLLPELEQDARCRVAHCRPGARPFDALAAALTPLLAPGLSATDHLIETHKLAAALQTQALTLAQATARTPARSPAAGRLLLIIDQFEELYALCPEPDMRLRFINELLAAVQAAPGGTPAGCTLLLTLRADFMGQALAYRPLADALQGGALLLGPMARQELRAAIEKPAALQGAAFEPGLVERILDNVGAEPGALPLLEFALTLLWEQHASGWLTHTAYEEIGQVEGALTRYAEQVYSALDDADQARARQVFEQLVRPGVGAEDIRRVAARDEIGAANWPLVQRLAGRRLVVTGRDASTGVETAEVAHEALIQRWERLRGWMATDRAFRGWQEGLRAALLQWASSAQDEGALLRGAPLAQAESWLAARPDELSGAEAAFIRAGVALRERREAEREAQRQRELAAERRGRRLLTALAGVLAVAALVALALTAYSLQQRRQALQAYSRSLAANAQKSLDDGDTAAALALALAAADIANPPPEARRVLLDAAYAPGARWQAQTTALFPNLDGPITALAISPDGENALAGLADGGLIYWNIASRAAHRQLTGHTGQVHDVVFSRDGARALSGGADGRVILWNLGDGREIRRFVGHSGVVRAVALSPDGRMAGSGGFAGELMLAPGELILWDAATGAELRRLEGHIAGVVALAFTPDGSALLASSGDAVIFSDRLETDAGDSGELVGVTSDMLLWDVATGTVRRRFTPWAEDAFTLAISPDGTRALAGSFYNNAAVLWDLQSGARLGELVGHSEGVRALAFSPDGRRALTGSADDSLLLWDVASGRRLALLTGHAGDVLDLAISADGRTGLSSARDGGLMQWDLVDAQEMQRLPGHQDAVWDVAFTPDGRQALSTSGAASPNVLVQDASLRLWDLASGAQLQSAALPVDVIMQVAPSPDGRTALVASTDGLIRVWDLAAWRESGRLEGHASAVTGVEFTPDGRRALSIAVDGTLILWDVPGRRILRRLDAHGPGLWSVAMSPDGRTALSDSGDSSMILWDLETGTEVRSFVRHDPPADSGSSGMAFLPDGRTAISCEQDGLLIEWDLATGAEVRRLGQHASLRTRIVISPDGRLAMTSGMDGTLMLWNLETGELVRRSTGHGILFDLAISPDGGGILAGSSDTTIFRWRLDHPALAELKGWVQANRYVSNAH
jgi:WD40 repeat protein/DNA-binding SARP family transcriptional activator